MKNTTHLQLIGDFLWTVEGEQKYSQTPPPNTYALSGFRDESDAGKLVVHTIEGLTPLTDREGRQHRIEELAGLSHDGHGNWYKQ